jgi:uncharacterized protein YggE
MKKTIISLALAALLLTGMALPAMASSNDAWTALLNKTVTSIDQLTTINGELTVVGTAAIAVEPDKASVTLGVVIEKPNIAEAQTEVNQTIQRIVDAVKALGVPENKIITHYYSVFPAYDYTQEPAPVRGYQVNNTLTVEVGSFALISLVIDKAVEAGANQVQDITFDTSKRSELYREALQSAIKAAQEKAAIAAFAANKNLGALRNVTETNADTAMYINTYDTRAESQAAGAKIFGGELNVTAQVTLVYDLP